ncbi:TPA: alpha/beta fold hydrolase, partial [Neisseria gonorrhoeae]
MLKPETIHIPGPAGILETIHIPSEQVPARGVAVINHPNPLQGGTNTNKVIQTAAKALSKLGFHCYLPNLRGVGGSEGTHDYGRGETQDCLAVIDYARAQHPEAPEFALSGFSFGGYVATFAAQVRIPDLLLLIGAAVCHYTDRPEPS